MNQSPEQVQILYEIAMSIGTSLDLQVVLQDSLRTILQKFNCSTGGVLQFTEGVFSPLYAIPRHPERNQAYQQAVSWLEQIDSWDILQTHLPYIKNSHDDYYHILELPNVGVLVLVKNSEPLPTPLLKSFVRLQKKLASAITACFQKAALEQSNQQLLQEVAERRDAEKQMAVLARFPAESPRPVLRATRKGQLLYANTISANMLAQLKCDVGDILPTAWRVFIEETMALQSNNEQEMTVGRRIYLAIAAPILEGDYVNLYLHDITKRKQTEQMLRLHKRAIEASENGITITDATDPELPLIYVNPAFEHMTGYRTAEVIGHNCRFLNRRDRNQRGLEIVRQALRQGTSCTVTLRNFRKDDSLFWNQLSISPLYDDKNRLTHFVGIQTDVTERKRVEETMQAAEYRLRSVVSNVPVILFGLDAKGYFTLSEGRGLASLNLKPNEVVGQSALEVYRNSPQILAQIERSLQGEAFIGLAEVGNIVFETYYEPVWSQEGQFAGTIGVAFDVTERHEFDRLRDEFVATVSHELRTPLASIMGYTETLLSERPGPLVGIQRRFLEHSYKSSHRLLKLVEELLTVSRIQQRNLKIERRYFHPAEIVEAIQTMVMPLLEANQINMTVTQEWPSDQAILGDPRRIEQVLSNLLHNAIKFTPPDGHIHLKSMASQTYWRVELRDTGIGIPSEEIPKLFNRFHRASNVKEAQIEGTGLGLYVCKAIVEAHQGQIGVTSQLHEGTMVWFNIPTNI